MAKKQVAEKSAPRGKYFKDLKRKKHEAGWLSLLKIGLMALAIFVVLALIFGYGRTMSISNLLLSGLQVGVLVIALVIFIVGLITVSENTAKEIKKK
jgi:hypothetical protein